MQYMGGKSRISKDISAIINKNIKENQTFVSLFCGSCAIESKVNAKYKICNDLHTYLIELWKALQNGYELPDVVTKEDYEYIKKNKDEDKALTAFIGFGCAFGGKWFGGFAKNKRGDNFPKQAKNGLYRDIKGLFNAKFLNLSYKNVKIPNNSIVYCDPPYCNTTKYSNSNNFDYDEFWKYMRELSKDNIVFISEEKAPDDFECIWSKNKIRTLQQSDNKNKIKTEKLFVYKKLIDEIHI